MLELTRQFGIGAQFGGKYFCHDVRVVRLPRHGASCPVAIAVSCSADRQARGLITAEGVFLEQLETDPAHYLPETTDEHLDDDVVHVDLNRPMSEIRAELTKYPVKTRLSLTGPLVVARDIAHAKIKERLDAGEPMPQYLRDHAVYYAGPAKTPEGFASGSFGPTTAGRMDSYVERVPGGRRLAGDAREGQPVARPVTQACAAHGGFYLGLDRRAGRAARAGLHPPRRGARVRRARHGGGLEDRGGGLPGVRRGRRQGQRLLRRRHEADGDDDPAAPRAVTSPARGLCPDRRVPHHLLVDPLRLLRSLRARSSTVRGQLAGAALIAVPALVSPIPVEGAAHSVLLVLAVVVGAAGAVVVFGGLFQWVFLPGEDTGADPADARPTTRDALRAVPHARGVWVGAVVACAVLTAGAVWVLALAVTGGGAGHVPEALMLALPAVLLGWAAWAARAMWTRDEGPA